MLRLLGLLSAFFYLSSQGVAQVQPPIEAYGELPEIRYAALSDSGTKIALMKEVAGEARVEVFDLNSGKITHSVDTDEIKVRGLNFAGDGFLLISAYELQTSHRLGGEFRVTATFALNLADSRIKQLLNNNDNVIAEFGTGAILGISPDKGSVFVPAWSAQVSTRHDLYLVDVESGKGRTHAKGNSYTRDWIVSPKGTILGREEYQNKENVYRVLTNIDGTNRVILKRENVERLPHDLVGRMKDTNALLLLNNGGAGGFDELRKLSFDGDLSASVLNKKSADVDWIISGLDRVIHGVQYSGAYPSYQFFDAALHEDMQSLIAATPDVSVQLVDWSGNWQKLLLKVEGDTTAGSYIVYDRRTKNSRRIGNARPDIPAAAIGLVIPIDYPARDGLTIPAIVTFPPGTHIATAANLPMLVLPHGGPEAYDAVGFDWMAQYFANRGYIVLQPNFRGSSGYGEDFVRAGNGEWGGKMQDDITDGVKVMISDGFADPDRICIAGASYGGYAALAGGAFTPDLYKCVVAIAPVSSVSKMLGDDRKSFGRDSWVLDYWEERLAGGRVSMEKLRSISPETHAEKFKAPVMLIHGENDRVIPIAQSEDMRNALRRADRAVEFVRLKNENHSLSNSQTRLQTLKAMSRFVDKHIGQ